MRELYKHGLAGHVTEFLGYRILYLLFSRNRAGKLPLPFFLLCLKKNLTPFLSSEMKKKELNSTLANLTSSELLDPSVIHAIAVRQAVSQGNYTKFFRLFNAAPKMGAYLMDHFVPRERVQALVIMTKAYVSFFLGSLFLFFPLFQKKFNPLPPFLPSFISRSSFPFLPLLSFNKVSLLLFLLKVNLIFFFLDINKFHYH